MDDESPKRKTLLFLNFVFSLITSDLLLVSWQLSFMVSSTLHVVERLFKIFVLSRCRKAIPWRSIHWVRQGCLFSGLPLRPRLAVNKVTPLHCPRAWRSQHSVILEQWWGRGVMNISGLGVNVGLMAASTTFVCKKITPCSWFFRLFVFSFRISWTVIFCRIQLFSPLGLAVE